MKNLHITCSTLKQRQDVFDVLEGMGFKSGGLDEHYLRIQAHLKSLTWHTWCEDSPLLEDSKELTYKQFMEQSGMQKLKQAIATTKLSNPQLSLKLGHSRKYITNLLNDGCSTELQKRLISEIAEVMAGTFKTDAEVIDELSAKLAEAQDASNHNKNTGMGYYSELSELKDYIADQERHHKDIREWNTNLDNANTELNAELNAARQTIAKLDSNLEYAVKTAQNDAQRIKTLESELHTSDTQNDQIRAIMGKHKLLGVLALLLVVVQTVIIWSLV